MSTAIQTKHTPAPWTFESFSRGSPTAPVSHKKIVGPDEGGYQKLIAEVSMQHDEHEADGRLLAAAPEMLEALECTQTILFLLQEEVQRLGHSADNVLPKVKAAICKARGE